MVCGKGSSGFRGVRIRECVDLQLEVLPVPEAVGLPNQPTYLVVEPLGLRIARPSVFPVAEDAVEMPLDRAGHRHELGDVRGAGGGAPVLEEQPRAELVPGDLVYAAKMLLQPVRVRQLGERGAHLREARAAVRGQALCVSGQQVAVALDVLFQGIIGLGHRAAAYPVEPVVHRLDDVEVVEHGLGVR